MISDSGIASLDGTVHTCTLSPQPQPCVRACVRACLRACVRACKRIGCRGQVLGRSHGVVFRV